MPNLLSGHITAHCRMKIRSLVKVSCVYVSFRGCFGGKEFIIAVIMVFVHVLRVLGGIVQSCNLEFRDTRIYGYKIEKNIVI